MLKTGTQSEITWHNKLSSFMNGKFMAVKPEKLVTGREQRCEFISADGRQKQSVVYHSTHSDNECRQAWLEIGEINEFYERIYALRKTLLARLANQPCAYGKIAGVDVNIVYPPAETPFNKIYFDTTIRAFGLRAIVETTVYELDNCDIETAISEIITLANAASLALKEKFERGNF